jgi:hypothetical protein
MCTGVIVMIATIATCDTTMLLSARRPLGERMMICNASLMLGTLSHFPLRVRFLAC